MTGREKFIKALRHEPITGHVPHFELVFYLTMEELGKVHPEHRHYSQWSQMSAKEKELQLQDMADCYLLVAEKYHHSAIFVHPNPGDFDSVVRLLQIIRERSGDQYFLMMHGDTTYSMPDGEHMMDFSVQLLEDGDVLKEQSRRTMDRHFEFARRLKEKDGGKLMDAFALCSDYCFNVNPFFTKDQFAEFISPVLKETIDTYRDLGYYTIKHTDGNIMPILDQMIACKPDAFHSLDPQGGVDLKEMKRICGNEIALIGNVNCGLLQTGTEEDVIADVRRALRDGMPGGGYIFSTSNCIYTGMDLDRYRLMWDVWQKEGIYR